jgi:M6 family metalloprotease-like protein
MLKIFLSVFIVIFSLGSLSAQSFNVTISGSSKLNRPSQAEDTVKILAILVNFQEDSDGATFGNGIFESIYSRDYGKTILDPIPHDAPYFEDHLTFVENYFTKVSKNNLHIEFTVLPDTFSVSKTMRNYSPPPGSDDFTPLAEFAVEAWTLADQKFQGFDFSAYDLFTIFHAGVGRDVSLPGSIGNERDLPSVYLSEKSFKEIFGESFDGIPVSGGSFRITNSNIMPETESRELSNIGGTVLLELTINGLLAASVCSHLGLPDLFDTETGLSAIGRFGLMDGQGIFAYSGTYPPEPTPWSKIYLGWTEPVTVAQENFNASLVTNLAASIADTVILKVPLNSTEYFLIENRGRDANNDGSKVTYKVDGTTITRTFLNDTTGYQSFDVDSLAGVILDVDEFDWAVPGSGILIWHIDENVINEKLADNKINTDKSRRGVDVEEADGVQDIGEEFQTIFGDIVLGEGTEIDLWYSSNPSELFQNRFAKDTRPNTRTISGANSLITMKDFSDISNRMEFDVEFEDSVVKPLFTSDLGIPISATHISALEDKDNNLEFSLSNNSVLYILDNAGNINNTINRFSGSKVPSVLLGNTKIYVGEDFTTLNVLKVNGNDSLLFSIEVGFEITSTPVLRKISAGECEVIIGTQTGNVLIYKVDEFINNEPVLDIINDINSDLRIFKIAATDGYYSLIGKKVTNQIITSSFYDSNGLEFQFNEFGLNDLVLTKNDDGQIVSIAITQDMKLYLIGEDGFLNSFQVETDGQVYPIALVDLKQDGQNYIVYSDWRKLLYIKNLNGTMADNFPFVDPEGIGFVGTPLTADIEGDNSSEIISITEDGRIFAIDGGTGKVISGFPISVGAGVSVTPILYNADGKTNLAVLNDQGVFTGWSISSVESKMFWSEENGNPQNTSFIDAADNTNRINEFFPSSRAYNYPNPVYDSETNIRYYVSEDSKINIKIFDLAGDFVAEMNDDAQGGMDNETVWNVSDIQSGVYLARIEATSASNRSEFAIVKIAVVK